MERERRAPDTLARVYGAFEVAGGQGGSMRSRLPDRQRAPWPPAVHGNASTHRYPDLSNLEPRR
jgi:hypothetical protein